MKRFLKETSSMTHKKGFTLAEVLITLTVIGVVAAITLPPLVQNYQKMVLVNQLKKEYSLWSQAFQKILADEEVDKLSDTTLFSGMGEDNCSSYTASISEACQNFYNKLGNYIKMSAQVSPNEYEDIDRTWGSNKLDALIKLSDGSILRAHYFYNTPTTKDVATCEQIKSLGGNMCSYIGEIQIDVNGNRGPNAEGRDIFIFEISDEGKLYPYCGKDYALYNNQTALSSNSSYWSNSTGYKSCSKSSQTNAYGYGCAARVMENGWKMDY